MALGIKQIKVVTQNNYSIESLYEAIKDHEFSCGQPKLVKHQSGRSDHYFYLCSLRVFYQVTGQ